MFWTGRSCPPSTGSFRGRSRRPAAPWSAKGHRQGSNATGWGAGGAIIWKRRRSWWTAAEAKGNERNISSFSAAPASRKTWKDSPENAETCCYGNNRALSPREQGAGVRRIGDRIPNSPGTKAGKNLIGALSPYLSLLFSG